ncbi:MAG: right-handed parallel beta-helix repeat-containing protein [Eudoraea sp.]|nr:right-handed parallel beta-helix repeat-containing protein [Eudoraea sp.]
MRNIFYYLIAMLFALVSCDKDMPETQEIHATLAGEEFTKVDLAAKKMKTTVVGTGIAAQDVAAVQNAVDNYNHVTLSGTFDFGSDETTGGVDINRENVIVQGPATILNGAKTVLTPELGSVRYPISIRAPGVEIRKLTLSGEFEAVLIYAQEDGKPVILEENNITASVAGFAASATPGGIKVIDNVTEALFGYLSLFSKGHTELVNNDITAAFDGVYMFDFNHRLDIVGNTFNSIGFTGIWIGAWSVSNQTDPEYGDNAPIRVIDNTFEMASKEFAAGIMIGASDYGINNVLVKGNTLTGEAGYGGLMKQPYGHNNIFIDNDLTGLTTYSPQIWILGGRNSHFKNNTLGMVEPFWLDSWAPAFKDAATLVSPINWHEKDFLNTPDPVHFGNHISNNDYTMTGVTGWSEDPESVGAVLLLDFLQKFDNGFTGEGPFQESFVMENFITENKFPSGTDVCNQVLDLNPGTNQIAGWKACLAKTNKSDKQWVKQRYENFGQIIKEKHQKREKIYKERKNKKM